MISTLILKFTQDLRAGIPLRQERGPYTHTYETQYYTEPDRTMSAVITSFRVSYHTLIFLKKVTWDML